MPSALKRNVHHSFTDMRTYNRTIIILIVVGPMCLVNLNTGRSQSEPMFDLVINDVVI